jgi:hypothetical protein
MACSGEKEDMGLELEKDYQSPRSVLARSRASIRGNPGFLADMYSLLFSRQILRNCILMGRKPCKNSMGDLLLFDSKRKQLPHDSPAGPDDTGICCQKLFLRSPVCISLPIIKI